MTADIYDVDKRLEVARARLGSLKYDHCNQCQKIISQHSPPTHRYCSKGSFYRIR
ncbi:MAG: hypothetical protein QXG58_06870 [Candidatus Bathyarchaeia archaeon]